MPFGSPTGKAFGAPWERGNKMSTFRQLALRTIVESGLNKESVDDVLSESFVLNWLKAAYAKILDSMPKGTANRQSSVPLLTEESKKDGTVDVNQGSNTVVGTGTSFAASDVGRAFRIANDNIWYKITAVAGQNLTLDTIFVGETAAGVNYFIITPLYAVPTIRWITSVVLAPFGELEELHPEKMTELHPYRSLAPGVPRNWVKQGIDQGSGKRLIELFPYADAIHRLEISGYSDLSEPTLTSSPIKEVDDDALVVFGIAKAFEYRAQLAAGNGQADKALAFTRLADQKRRAFEEWLSQLSIRDSRDTAEPLVRVRIKHQFHQPYFDPVTTAFDHVWNKP